MILNKDILKYDKITGTVQFSKDHKIKQQELINQKLEASFYWIGFGVGVECLVKAVLLKRK